MLGSLSLLLLAITFGGKCVAVDWDEPTPLDLYVHREDPYYSWEVLDSHEGEGFTLHVLNMTSQQWMDETVSAQSIMWHYMSIYIPHEININDAAIIRMAGGFSSDGPPDLDNVWSERLGAMAVRSGAVMAQVSLVPFQPVTFTGTLIPRLEDSIIAYTWKLYIEDEDEPDPDIVLQLPMVKAAKQAMDTVTEFTASLNLELDIQSFLPTGQSKRGWVAWLLGCTDQRVFAIAPIVYDLLDFTENLHRHTQSLGGWSIAFIQYWLENISRYLVHPRVEQMATFIDPLAYNERLTMPKLMTIASGDEFFRPSSSHIFWHLLNGYEEHNYMLILENARHIHTDLQDRVYFNIEAFFTSIVTGYDIPSFTWTRQEDDEGGSITVSTNQTPSIIRAWWADTTNFTLGKRDFRLFTAGGSNPILFREEAVEDLGGGSYSVEYPLREDGDWRGFFIEARFPGPDDRELIFSSEIQVIPDVFPFPRCTTEEECDMPLV